MRKIFLALVLLSGLAAAAQALDYNSDSPRPTRFAGMQNLLAPPANSTYSLGGYAPADPNTDPNQIDKSQLDSPPGYCGGLWDGYQARPCYHRHHWGQGGWGNGGGCGCNSGGCNSGCNSGGCNSGCGCNGGGWGGGYGGGWGMGGYGYGGPAYIAPGCGCASPCCAPACRQRHHCKLFGCRKRSNCCADVATTCDSCGCGATDSTQPTPSNDGMPRPAPELLEPAPAPAPAPGPSAQRQPRIWRSLAGFGAMSDN
jgi:hypothetical protein